MREAHVERHLKRRAEAAGALVRKMVWPGHTGAPDRLVVWPGGVWAEPDIDFIELKAPGRKPDPHQDREIAKLRALGCNVFVLDSIEAVDAYIKQRTGQ